MKKENYKSLYAPNSLKDRIYTDILFMYNDLNMKNKINKNFKFSICQIYER